MQIEELIIPPVQQETDNKNTIKLSDIPEDDIRACGKLAMDNWTNQFHPKYVNELALLVEAGNMQYIRDIRIIRRGGHILSSCLGIFGKNSSGISGHVVLVKQLGRFVDYHEGRRVEYDLSVLNDYKVPEISVDYFQYCKQLVVTLQEIEDILSNDRISLRQFHTIRKRIRNLKNIWRLYWNLKPSNYVAQKYSALNQITEQMGAEMDTVISSLPNHIDYSDIPVVSTINGSEILTILAAEITPNS